MSDHGLTGELILREVFDSATGGLKTTPSSATSFSIELDAADGDSVIAKAESSSMTQGTYSCIGMKTACLYGTGTVEVSPDDTGETFQALTVTALVPFTICARRIRLTGVGSLVMQSV